MKFIGAGYRKNTEVIIGHHAKTLELPLLVKSVVSREVKENLLLGVISPP